MTIHTVETGSDTAGVRELIAEDVLAEQRVMYLDRDNHGTTWAPLARAIQSDRAFFGKVKQEILALDIDGASGMTVIEPLRAELRGCGIVLVECASGGLNCRHVFARIDDPSLMASLRERLRGQPEVGIRATIRPPLTPHRRLPTRSSIVGLTAEQAHLALRAPRRVSLSGRGVELLHSHPEAGDYTGQHLNSLILTYVNAGWPRTEAYQQILESPGGARLRRERDRGRDPRAYFVREWNRAAIFVVEHPPRTPDFHQPRRHLALRDQAWQGNWTGVTGTTDFCVLLVLISKAERLGTTQFDLDTRSLQQLTGLRQESVVDALSRLGQDRWIARTKATDPRNAQRFNLLVEENRPHQPSTDDGCVGVGIGLSGRFLPTDCFAGNLGLGRPAALIYEVLMSGDVDRGDLASLIPLGHSALKSGVERLLGHRLVVEEDGHLTVGDTLPHDVAAVLGNVGYEQERQDRIERDRVLHNPRRSANGGMEFIVMPARSSRCESLRRDGEPCGSYAVWGEATCREHRVCAWDTQMAEEFQQDLLNGWEVA